MEMKNLFYACHICHEIFIVFWYTREEIFEETPVNACPFCGSSLDFKNTMKHFLENKDE